MSAIAHRARAEAMVYTGRLKAACRQYEAACTRAREAAAPGLRGQILVGRIGTLLAMGDTGTTPKLVREARRLLSASADHDYLRRLFVNLGSGHYHRERYRDAYRANREAIRLMEAAGHRDHVWASVQLNQGIACTHLSRIEEARERFRLAEAFGRAHSMDHLSAHARLNLGSLEALQGDYRAALNLLSGVEETFEQQGARDLLAAALLEQAQIHLDLAMPAEAISLARRAGDAFAEEEMDLDMRLARLAEARGLVLLGRLDEAARHLTSALRFYEERGIRPRQAFVLLELSRVWSGLGDHGGAIRAAEDSLRIARRPGMGLLEATCRCHLSDLHRAAGDLPRAARVLRPLHARAPQLPVRVRMDLHRSLARLYRDRGETRAALREYRRAARFLERQRDLTPGLELRASSFDRDVAILHEQIAILVQAARPRSAHVLHVMEASRGRSFHELPSTAGPAAVAELRLLKSELASVMKQIETAGSPAARPAGPPPAALQRQARLLEGRVASRMRRMQSASPLPERSRRAGRAGEISAALRPEECLVEYLVVGDIVTAVVVTPEGCSVRVLDTPVRRIREAVDHLRLQMNLLAATAGEPAGSLEFHRQGADSRLRELFSWLLEPLLAQVDRDRGGRGKAGAGGSPAPRRLIIVAHDLLHQVPFECLRTDTGYIDSEWEILRCPTAGFLVDRRRHPVTRTAGPPVIIAGPRAEAPAIETEARSIARRWPAGTASLLLDPEPSQVLAALGSAGLVHLAAHSQFRRDNPLFSALHFPRGMIFLVDLVGLRTAAELVVLSACSTGEVAGGAGDALLGIAHAFLAGGSRRLVASLWRIDDEATSGWMDHFYTSYLASRDPVAALRLANQAHRTRWPHPFYWGSFCVLGA